MPRVKQVKPVATHTETRGGVTHAAKTYKIADLKIPDLEGCWSACNGVDGFGQVDSDEPLTAARKQHGENMLNLPGRPRLTLFRAKADSDLMARIWYVRTFTDELDGLRVLSSFSRALREFPFPAVDATLIDWGGDEASSDRFELSFEFVCVYSWMPTMLVAVRQFMKTYDHAKLR